jgi:hypothetical protein
VVRLVAVRSASVCWGSELLGALAC